MHDAVTRTQYETRARTTKKGYGPADKRKAGEVFTQQDRGAVLESVLRVEALEGWPVYFHVSFRCVGGEFMSGE